MSIIWDTFFILFLSMLYYYKQNLDTGSSEDKERASKLMDKLEFNNYELFPSINEVIKGITEPITKAV